MKNIYLSLIIAAVFSITIRAQTKWSIDESHSKIGFAVSHMVVSEVEGIFGKYSADVETTGDNFENAKINIKIDVASIDTKNEKRDEHLRNEDFFDAPKYPEIKFVSKSFKKIDSKTWKLVGDFTIKNVTKEITLTGKFNGTVKDPWGNTRSGFKLSRTINRFDYGLKWSNLLESGGLVVGDEVELNITVELIKK